KISKTTSAFAMKQADEVIAHELAHQWFGNLVTMKWWNDLWLNESFATFMSFKSTDNRHKEWNVFEDFIMTQTSGALDGDSLKKTHPIEVEVRNPDEIAQIFDEISYGKGGNILRMIEAFAGEDAFREGVRNHLKKNSFSNAVGTDLWNAIEKASGKNISDVMSAWIKTPGYPIITATKKGEKIKLTQKKFRLDGTTDDTVWPVPLTVIREGGKIESVLFNEKEMEINNEGFLRLNYNHTGFYRINYEGELLEHVLSNSSSMNSFDKWGIVSDSLASLLSGASTYDTYLKTLERFSKDGENLVVNEIIGQI
ncbi:Peptidase M1 membrane alanine aminopeptidase, partial [mine drainage metagenome]